MEQLPLTPQPARKTPDKLAGELCERLQSLGTHPMSGKRLAEELHLSGTRELRHLVAYARVHHHRHEIVGVPGIGYFWGPACPQLVTQAIGTARRMGRCWFFIAALLKREGTAMAAAQMIFDFMERAGDEPGREADDLETLVAAENTSLGQFLDVFVTRLAESAEGREVLANVGRKHAKLLITESARNEMLATIETLRRQLSGLGRTG